MTLHLSKCCAVDLPSECGAASADRAGGRYTVQSSLLADGKWHGVALWIMEEVRLTWSLSGLGQPVIEDGDDGTGCKGFHQGRSSIW
jgi:hypothetical protein